MYYRGAAAAIIVYDITRPNTFKTLKNWVEELRNQGPKDIAIAIAGNKADLANLREVDTDTAKGILFFPAIIDLFLLRIIFLCLWHKNPRNI